MTRRKEKRPRCHYCGRVLTAAAGLRLEWYYYGSTSQDSRAMHFGGCEDVSLAEWRRALAKARQERAE